MPAQLPADLESRFLELCDIWRSHQLGGQPVPFVLARRYTNHVSLSHPGISNERTDEGTRQRELSLDDLDLLEKAQLVSVREDAVHEVMTITRDGEAYAERARRLLTELPPGGLDWAEEVLPVLQAMYESYKERPNPMGVEQNQINFKLGRSRADPATDRVLHALEETDYFVATVSQDQSFGPTMARFTEKGLQQVANWPSGSPADLIERLLATLDARIMDSEDPAERTKLQHTRDAILALGRDVFTEVMAKVIAGG